MAATDRESELLAAAAEVFAEQPYAEVALPAVAARAQASEALIYRYFGSKAGLYTAVVRAAIDRLAAEQRDAIAAVHPATPVREKLRASLRVYLNHIAAHPRAWAVGMNASLEPPGAVSVRAAAREAYVAALADMLASNPSARHRYALWGYFGFLDGACLAWVRTGCPEDDRNPLIDAALGCLEGALGDWAA